MYQDIYNCICQNTKTIRFIIHYVKPTAQLLFRIRFPKGGPTCRRQVVNLHRNAFSSLGFYVGKRVITSGFCTQMVSNGELLYLVYSFFHSIQFLSRQKWNSLSQKTIHINTIGYIAITISIRTKVVLWFRCWKVLSRIFSLYVSCFISPDGRMPDANSLAELAVNIGDGHDDSSSSGNSALTSSTPSMSDATSSSSGTVVTPQEANGNQSPPKCEISIWICGCKFFTCYRCLGLSVNRHIVKTVDRVWSSKKTNRPMTNESMCCAPLSNMIYVIWCNL